MRQLSQMSHYTKTTQCRQPINRTLLSVPWHGFMASGKKQANVSTHDTVWLPAEHPRLMITLSFNGCTFCVYRMGLTRLVLREIHLSCASGKVGKIQGIVERTPQLYTFIWSPWGITIKDINVFWKVNNNSLQCSPFWAGNPLTMNIRNY